MKPNLLISAGACLFSCQGTADLLVNHLLNLNPFNLMEPERRQKECQQQLAQDIDNEWPRRFRLNDIAHAVELIWPSEMLVTPEFKALDQLVAAFFDTTNGGLHYRKETEPDFVRLCARLDPAYVAAWQLAKDFRDQTKTEKFEEVSKASERIDALQPLFSPPVRKNAAAVAENHVHLGGVYGSGLALMLAVLHPEKGQLKQHAQQELIKELQRLLAALLQQPDWLLPSAETKQTQQQTVTKDLQHQRIHALIQYSIGQAWLFQTEMQVDWYGIAQQPADESEVNPAWLRKQVALHMQAGDVSKAWLYLLIWLWWHYQDARCCERFRTLTLYFLNRINHLRREVIMDGQGLSRFVQYYDEPLRWGKSAPNQFNAAQVLFQNAKDVAELKVTRSKFNPKDIALWLKQLEKAVQPDSAYGDAVASRFIPPTAAQTGAHRALMERWHFCIHFLRTPAFQHHPEKVWHEARALLQQCFSLSGWDRPELLGLSSQLSDEQQQTLRPAAWIRGLDVAGDENLVRIEVYAPALRWLRQAFVARQTEHSLQALVGAASDRADLLKGWHFSIHAGEDYAHPLSGLRHLDETVQFCAMKEGDRLGHALALGVDAESWLARHGDALLPVDEHVDNLVWAWHEAGALAERLPWCAKVKDHLEKRIRRLLPYVPWLHPVCFAWENPLKQKPEPRQLRGDCQENAATESILIDDLYGAWKLRRNCYWQFLRWQQSGVQDDATLAALPDLDLLKQSDNKAGKLFLQRARWLGVQKPSWQPETSGKNNGDEKTSGKAASGKAGKKDSKAQKEEKTAIKVRPALPKPPPFGHCNFTKDGLLKVRVSSLRRGTELPAVAEPDALKMLTDFYHPDELKFIHALQDVKMQEYADLGLMIEVNLTSNTYIARLEDFIEHPVFRWHPVAKAGLNAGGKFNVFGLRKKPMKVCINTDDPGIMPTTLRTEFRLLKEAAMDRGEEEALAEAWVKKLRQAGVKEFKQKHVPVWRKAH